MISLNNINKKYGNTTIYKDTSYNFNEKALTCFYGPSGCGKTTLFNIIAGFDRDFDGEIIVGKQELSAFKNNEMSSYRFNNIGFVFQNYYLVKGYTALESILMAIDLKDNISESEKLKRGLGLLATLKLENEAHQKIETLSGGQKQRVAIARALINDPEIILADEPTGALDIENSTIIMEILKDISKEKTVIIITHDDEVLNYADEVITLDNNKIKITKELERADEGSKISKKLIKQNLTKSKINKLAKNNFIINKFKYILAAIIVAFASSALIASFSSKSISNKVMDEFKEKNSFYNIGQATSNKTNKEDLEDIYNKLLSVEELENVYMQSNIKGTTIKFNSNEVLVPVKAPTVLANESLSYGKIPGNNENGIALSPSIANGLHSNIKELIGKEVLLQYIDESNIQKEVKLVVTGITNNSRQDYIISSELEKQLYKDKNLEVKDAVAISFTMKDFNKIPETKEALVKAGINTFTKADEIKAFQETFMSLIKLFTLLSYLIFLVGTIISAVILNKIFSDRGSEIAILGAIGYEDSYIKKILIKESMIFSCVTTIFSAGFIFILNILCKKTLGYGLTINLLSVMLLVLIIILIDIGLSNFISGKLLKKDKSLMLR